MTILLYDYRDLQERPPKQLKAWKAWHLILYVFAAVFGIVNYVFLQNTMELVDDNCVLFPRELEFHGVELSEAQIQDFSENQVFSKNITDGAQPEASNITDSGENKGKAKRDVKENDSLNTNEVNSDFNVTTGNKTYRLALDTSRSLFEADSNCMFAEYMPLLSTVFAAVWITMFTMCPSGGHARTGLSQPWRILAPALLFALVMVGLTAHSFILTNGGLHAFCEAFYELTNSTTCAAVDPFIEQAWNRSWGMGARAGASRAASAGVCASWAGAAALLLARCLAAPDFVVRRTTVYLKRDPQEKVLPYLDKSLKSPRQTDNLPIREDNVSLGSEPTVTTELVTASMEQGDSAPTSLIVTPLKTSTPHNIENIEMSYTPQERIENVQS